MYTAPVESVENKQPKKPGNFPFIEIIQYRNYRGSNIYPTIPEISFETKSYFKFLYLLNLRYEFCKIR